MSGIEVRRVAERALLVRFRDDRLEVAVARAQALAASLDRDETAGAAEKVLGAGNLLVVWTEPPAGGWQRRLEALERLAAEAEPQAAVPGMPHEIPVAYGGREGPDLETIARRLGRTPEEVVALHAAPLYTVAFVGFSPGFPYLIGLPPELERPRRDSPRARVPAGSVAIAGPFAGIYPSPTPGGWHLLGRTSVELFDPGAARPNRLAPGDRVRFVPLGMGRA